MNEQEIKQKLDKLADERSKYDAVILQRQDEISKIYTPEIKDQIEAVCAKYDSLEDEIARNLMALEAEVKQAVITEGASVKGTFLHAIYNPGKVSWDSKALDIWGKVHPEILGCRKQGEPFMTLRGVK